MLDLLNCERGKKIYFRLLSHVAMYNRNGIERVDYGWTFASK